MRLVVASALLAAAGLPGGRAEAEVGALQPGYPGYQPARFQFAPRRAEGRALFYRQTPKVERLQSPVHELYMRPYNYVSYEMGGGTKYQYETQHPQYNSQPTYSQHSQPSQPTYKQPSQPSQPTYNQQSYHNNQPTYAPVYRPPKPTPTYPAPTPAPYYHSPTPAYYVTKPPAYHGPTYHYQPYHLPTTPAPCPSPAPTPAAHLEQAAAAVVSGEGVLGTVHFLQIGGPAAPVLVTGNITGLTPGLHGFHVHQLGDLSGGCKSTGGHFNPLELKHGAPGDRYRHVGDLGNIMAGEDGVAVLEITDSQLSLNGIASIIGRGVVVHAGMDDLGRGGNDGSLATGNAGGRVACGVVGRARGPA